jgi:tetratricopeptide (TPR) repeat protein
MHCDTIEHLVLHLAGPLRLCGADGRDVTPKSQKAQAVLALLATTPGLSRPRTWIQDKLWSDSPPERGASNLRQCIHRMRRDVPIKGEWLLSDNQRLALDPDFVSVCLEPDPQDLRLSSEPPEFCEGLDVADPEFEDWIRDRRLDFEDRWAELEASPPEPQKPVHLLTVRPNETSGRTVLLIAPPQSADECLRSLESIICTDIAANVSHIGGVDVRFQSNEKALIGLEDAIRLEVRTFRFGDNLSLQSVLSDPANGALYWSDVRHLSSLGSHSFASDYADAVAHVTSATAVQFAEGPNTGSVTRQAYRAISDLLTFDPAKFAACEKALASLDGSPRSAALDSWRAYLRVTQVLERTSTDPKSAAEEAIALSRRALERDGRNPVVMSHSSHVALYLENNTQRAWALAKAAVQNGASSPLTHNLWSAAAAAVGDQASAREASRRALALSANQPNRSFWYILECFANLRERDFEEARKYAELAHQMSPAFRPPLRYLIALDLFRGNETGAARAIEKLRKFEPGFTIEQFNEEDYPTLTLRRSGLLEEIARRRT